MINHRNGANNVLLNGFFFYFLLYYFIKCFELNRCNDRYVSKLGRKNRKCEEKEAKTRGNQKPSSTEINRHKKLKNLPSTTIDHRSCYPVLTYPVALLYSHISIIYLLHTYIRLYGTIHHLSSTIRSHQSTIVNHRSSIMAINSINLLVTLVICLVVASVTAEQDEPVEYGVDVSAPMHNMKVSNNYPWLPHNADPQNNPTPPEYAGMPIQWLGNKQEQYDKMIKGCSVKYPKPKGICAQVELDRVQMALRQPSSMQNYTDLGFKKIRTPPAVWKLIQDFWEKNKDNKMMTENWPKGNTYVNHWDSPTYMISVEDSKLRGGGHIIKQAIWDAAKDTVQEWTGEELTECSLYGIRVYTEGAVLATHVDRMPLVSSAIVNVAQDVDEPWPIEVYGHDGKAYNVTMEPGDMVLVSTLMEVH